MVCIACPVGCRLLVKRTGPETVEVSGNKCPKGEVYGREEILSPRRLVTAVVRTDSADYPCAPVRTSTALEREHLAELLRALATRVVTLPICAGDVCVEDFRGVRVVFTRTLPPNEIPPVGQACAEPEG
jgi:CxxC motif-containing protein